jgi:pyruvate ferredoxin oxidoreductase beta subunit
MAAHKIPYVAQASISHWRDLIQKAAKAISVKGPAFLNILAPCPRGWRFPSEKTIELAKLAVQTGFWPLYEVENGVWRLNFKPKELKPITEWLSLQGRFKHLFKPDKEHLLKSWQERINRDWQELLKRCSES